jgi:hypothetical protein
MLCTLMIAHAVTRKPHVDDTSIKGLASSGWLRPPANRMALLPLEVKGTCTSAAVVEKEGLTTCPGFGL